MNNGYFRYNDPRIIQNNQRKMKKEKIFLQTVKERTRKMRVMTITRKTIFRIKNAVLKKKKHSQQRIEMSIVEQKTEEKTVKRKNEK